MSDLISNRSPGFLNFQLTNTTTWLWRWLPHRLSKCQSLTTVLLRTPTTQMIFFNQGMLLLSSNHFLNNFHASISHIECPPDLVLWTMYTVKFAFSLLFVVQMLANSRTWQKLVIVLGLNFNQVNFFVSSVTVPFFLALILILTPKN